MTDLMNITHVFLATPINYTEERARDRREKAAKALGITPDLITLAADEFHSTFRTKGGWDGWTDHVAKGVDFYTRKPVYDTILCVEKEIGRATAQIVEKALVSGRDVRFLGEDTLHAVYGVDQADDSDWQTGWRLVLRDEMSGWDCDDTLGLDPGNPADLHS